MDSFKFSALALTYVLAVSQVKAEEATPLITAGTAASSSTSSVEPNGPLLSASFEVFKPKLMRTNQIFNAYPGIYTITPRLPNGLKIGPQSGILSGSALHPLKKTSFQITKTFIKQEGNEAPVPQPQTETIDLMVDFFKRECSVRLTPALSAAENSKKISDAIVAISSDTKKYPNGGKVCLKGIFPVDRSILLKSHVDIEGELNDDGSLASLVGQFSPERIKAQHSLFQATLPIADIHISKIRAGDLNQGSQMVDSKAHSFLNINNIKSPVLSPDASEDQVPSVQELIISESILNNFLSAGIVIQDSFSPISNILIYKNSISNVQLSLGVRVLGKPAQNVVVVENTLTNIGWKIAEPKYGFGVLISGGDNVRVFDNQIRQVSEEGIRVNNSKNIKIYSNVVEDFNPYSKLEWVNAGGIKVNEVDNAEVFDNKVARMNFAAIEVLGGDRVQIYENELIGGPLGIRLNSLEAKNGSVKNTYIRGNRIIGFTVGVSAVIDRQDEAFSEGTPDLRTFSNINFTENTMEDNCRGIQFSSKVEGLFWDYVRIKSNASIFAVRSAAFEACPDWANKRQAIVLQGVNHKVIENNGLVDPKNVASTVTVSKD